MKKLLVLALVSCFVLHAGELILASVNSIVLGALAIFGFVEGEFAVQPEGVADGVWTVFCLLPALGFAIALMVLLFFYKLRDKDVQVMAQFNNGDISKEEAEEILAPKYGPAHN